MKQIIIILVLFIFPFGAIAQLNLESVISQIEKNNTTLQAYQDLAKAQKLETQTGIFPDNPEFGFNYLWGDPSAIGNRHDISIIQSFDFPTAYGIKKQIAKARGSQVDLEYQFQRLEILAKAKIICNELIYLNTMNKELLDRFGHASKIADAYNRKFEKGESNILERNKSALNLLNAKNELEANNTERLSLLSELIILDKGNPSFCKCW